ncbi:MAG: DUF86 domain-containing protein [Chloroflexi bacterium]|nr:DUF86 domain-containing protein [Chloroflexota bacterium]
MNDIVDHINRIEPHSALSLDELRASPSARDAVLYNLIIIGEAVKGLPKDLTNAYSDIEWAQIARFRDRAVHYYHRTSDALVLETLKTDIPELKSTVLKMIADLAQSPDSHDA